jgi:hypothetical protein
VWQHRFGESTSPCQRQPTPRRGEWVGYGEMAGLEGRVGESQIANPARQAGGGFSCRHMALRTATKSPPIAANLCLLLQTNVQS